MSFRQELAAHIAEIRELAWEKRHDEWSFAYHTSLAETPRPGVYPPPAPAEPIEPWAAVECDFGIDLNERLNRFYFFGDADIEQIQIMLNGLNDHIALAPLGTLHPPKYLEYPGVWDHIETAAIRDMPAVQELLDDWEGEAAGRFYGNFLNPLQLAVQHQLGLVQELGRITRAYQRVVDDAQTDITTIAEKTKEALRNHRVGADDDFPLLEFSIVVAGAVANVTAPPLAESAIVVAGSWVMALRQQPPEEQPKATITGRTVDEILNKTNAAVNELLGYIDAEETLIATALDAALTNVTTGQAHFLAEDRYLAGDLGNLDKPETQQSVLDMARLYQAGKVEMSAGAYHYDRAAQRLRLCTGVEGNAFGTWFTRSRPDWRSLCDLLENEILDVTRDRMIAYGDALCLAAQQYAETDADVGTGFGQVQEKFDDLMATAPPKETLNNQPVITPQRRGGPL